MRRRLPGCRLAVNRRFSRSFTKRRSGARSWSPSARRTATAPRNSLTVRRAARSFATPVRSFFRGKDASNTEHDGDSVDSSPVEIFGFGERHRAGLATDPLALEEARQIRLFLKDEARIAERGQIIIREESGGFVIELVAGDARIELTSSGEIILHPAAGAPCRSKGICGSEATSPPITFRG